MLTSPQIRSAIPLAFDEVSLPGLVAERGQVRDNYALPDGRRIAITTDRFSVFDQRVGLVPYHGQILNQLTAWWFEQTADITPNHAIDIPDPNVTIALSADPLPIAIIVRGFICGVTPSSLWAQYEAGERVIYGRSFPEGLRKNQELPRPIVTAAEKTFGQAHERPLTVEDVLARGVSAELWDRIHDVALRLFQRGRQLSVLADLLLVDSKYEFGLDLHGDLVLIDELHTPNSSRFWRVETYDERFEAGKEPESLDRELIRLWYHAKGYRTRDVLPPLPDTQIVTVSRRYQQVYEQLCGQPFRPADYPAQPRVIEALRRAGALD